MTSRSDTAPGRFEEKVNRTESCWLWTAYINPDGYGRFSGPGRTWSAHRYAYELWVGPIPQDLEIDHLCAVRHCVNPAHLEAVTRLVNIRRSGAVAALRRRALAMTHCKRDHEFTPENTYIDSRRGLRHCRTCRRDAKRRYRLESATAQFPGVVTSRT